MKESEAVKLFGDRAKEELRKSGINPPKRLATHDDYENGLRTVTCEKHGEFNLQMISGMVNLLRSTCSECVNEYQMKVEEKSIELEKNYQREKYHVILQSFGVKRRHYRKDFDNYIADTDEKKNALESVKYFCEKIKDGECKNMILCGSVGTGKTHLGMALCQDLAKHSDKENRFRARIETVANIIRRYRATWKKDAEESEEQVIDYYSNIDLLIMDEVGVQNGSDSEINTLFEIINNRYENRLPLMIISNLEKGEIAKVLGDRIIDRLKEDGCRVLGMAWDSHRESHKEKFEGNDYE